MKKIIASIITILMLLSVCIIGAIPASAADGINYDDWLIFDGVIIEYCGSDTEVVVPTVDADGLPVTVIGPNAFAGNENTPNEQLEKVVIPEGITEIQNAAFEYCTSLIEVSLPYSLQKAQGSAFRRCHSLTSMVIPGNLKIVPKDFISGSPLTEFVISYGVEEITCDAFGGIQTAEIVFPETVYHIGGRAINSIGKEAGERMEIYITNDDATIGVNNGDTLSFPENWGAQGAFVELTTWNNEANYNETTKIHVYGLKDGSVKQYVKEFMNDAANKPWGYAVFHGMEADELKAKSDWCKENGIQKPDETKKENDDKNNDKSDDDDEDGNSNGSSNKNKNNNNSASSGDMTQMMMFMMFGMGGFLLIIIIVVVVLVIVMGGKKKKKKKKKAKVEAPLEEAVAEEVAEEAPVEEAAEEKGEEE